MTKQHVISQFLRTYPDMAAQSEEYFDRSFRRLLGETALSRRWVEVPLTAGERDCPLPLELIEVTQVIVADAFSAADGWKGRILSAVFDETGPGFSLDAGSGGAWVIRLYPAPSHTSGPGGFPKLAVYGAFWEPMALGQTLPEGLLDPSVLTSRMKELASEDLDPPSASYYRQEADRKTGELKAWLSERISGERGSLRPDWSYRAGRII